MSKAALIEQADRWFRGEDKQLTFDIVDADDAPVNAGGWTVVWILEELHDGVADVLSKSGDSITFSDSAGTNDRVTVKIESTDTVSLNPRVYKQSLWRTDGDAPQLLASGSAMLQQGPELDVGS